MEDSSDISSISESQNIGNEIPAINIEQFLMQEHAKSLSSIHSDSAREFPKIFTVAQTLKDPLILNHIKPDYGSLGEFIGDLNLSKDFMNQKKRKVDVNQDQIQEKRIRAAFADKTKEELNQIYISKSSSNLQRKVAGKLLVQNLFQDSFGVSLAAFESQNIKPQPPKSYKINLSNIEDIFMGKNPNANASMQKAEKKDSGAGDKDMQMSTSKNKRKDTQKHLKQSKQEAIEAIKTKYPSFRKLQIKKQCPQYRKLFPKTDEENEEIVPVKAVKKEEEIEKPAPTFIFQIDRTCFRLEKLNIKPELMLFIVNHFQLDKIEKLVLNQVRIGQETICFLLQIVRLFCPNIISITLSGISLQKVDNLAVRLREILECLPIDELNLNMMDLETKSFCIICLGIGNNKTLHSLNLDNNGIDERACKSLELISKHCQNLRKIYLRKNYIKNHHLSYFPTEARNKVFL